MQVLTGNHTACLDIEEDKGGPIDFMDDTSSVRRILGGMYDRRLSRFPAIPAPSSSGLAWTPRPRTYSEWLVHMMATGRTGPARMIEAKSRRLVYAAVAAGDD